MSLDQGCVADAVVAHDQFGDSTTAPLNTASGLQEAAPTAPGLPGARAVGH